MNAAQSAGELRRELGERAREWARGREHVESYGSPPVIVFAPEGDRHGNFFDPAYRAILARPEWLRRFDKIHAQGRALPRAERRWRELDSSMSSDALLMNIFCTPAVAESAAIRLALGVDAAAEPEFGWKARVPLANGRFDRTEVDLRWGGLLGEAKLTESDFQTRSAAIVEGYRDFEEVFERELLPRVELRAARRRSGTEFAEEFTQEWEAGGGPEDEEAGRLWRESLAEQAWLQSPAEPGYAHSQLIRNVLAAHASGASFAVFLDERRPELREAWFTVMAAVRPAALRTRLKMMTWQELAALLPDELQVFLAEKYGIRAA
ncbi:MAG: hypothetical protein WCE75_14345 [Terracidiphilus sp.]